MIFEIVKPKRFNYYLKKNKRVEFITVHPEPVLKKYRLFLTLPKRGGAGFAITSDGEIVNLFNNTNIKGLGESMVQWAVNLGAHKLMCFDDFLKAYYEKLGFKVVKRVPWDDKFAPANWKYEIYGKPAIVYMVR